MKKGVIKKIYSDDVINEMKLNNMFLNYSFSAYSFLFYRIIICLLVLGLLVLFTNVGIVLGPIICVVIYKFSYYFIYKVKLNRLSKVYDRDAVNYFTSVKHCLEDGMNIRTSLKNVSSSINSDLSTLIGNGIRGVSTKSLYDTLSVISTPSKRVNKIIGSIANSENSNIDLISLLVNEIDGLKSVSDLKIKSRIEKLPLIIFIVSLIMLIPLILLIILSPFIVNIFS